jgi:flagellin
VAPVTNLAQGVRGKTSDLLPRGPWAKYLFKALSAICDYEVRIMTEINTNLAGQITTNTAITNNRPQGVAMVHTSKDLRINSTSEGVAGLTISQVMKTEVSGLEMLTRNINDAISILETVGDSSQEIAFALQRMRDLALQAATDTFSVTDRAELDLEFGQLHHAIHRIATQPTWNTMTLMSGSNDLASSAVASTDLTVQLAATKEMVLTIKSWDPRTTMRTNVIQQTVDPLTGLQIVAGNQFTADGLVDGGADIAPVAGAMDTDSDARDNSNNNKAAGRSVSSTKTQAFGSAVLFARSPALGSENPERLNILSKINAEYVLVNIDKAIGAASEERAKYDAYTSRLEHEGDNLASLARPEGQSSGRIADIGVAVEASKLSRSTMIRQANTAMSTQANTAKQTVLTLLQ